MAREKVVSAKTHTKKQLDDYANQNNPNNKAYQARMANQKSEGKNSAKSRKDSLGVLYPQGWMYYGNPFDFE